jgi:hypothetical protein
MDMQLLGCMLTSGLILLKTSTRTAHNMEDSTQRGGGLMQGYIVCCGFVL